jgi:phosphatidylglycerol:prolipoprotein diacylglycerol transferase
VLEALSVNRYFIYLSVLYSLLIIYVAIKAQREQMNRQTALDISIIIMVLGFAGGRLAHVFWEAPFYYKNNLLEILKFWNGGFIFYGGAIAALAGASVFLYFKRQNFWMWADFYTPVVSIGYALGRVSCLISGCCYGRSCDLYLPFTDRHPTQVYASLFELLNFILILKFQKKLMKYRSGILFLSWAICHAIGRIVMEYFREDFRGSQILQMSFGTFLSLSIIVISVSFIYARISSPNNSKSAGE